MSGRDGGTGVEPLVTLVGVFCPCCGQRAHTMALETGPQVIRHDRSWTDASGRRAHCRQTWVAVPMLEQRRVELQPVQGRKETDEALKGAAERWLAEHQARQLSVFERLFLQGAVEADQD